MCIRTICFRYFFFNKTLSHDYHPPPLPVHTLVSRYVYPLLYTHSRIYSNKAVWSIGRHLPIPLNSPRVLQAVCYTNRITYPRIHNFASKERSPDNYYCYYCYYLIIIIAVIVNIFIDERACEYTLSLPYIIDIIPYALLLISVTRAFDVVPYLECLLIWGEMPVPSNHIIRRIQSWYQVHGRYIEDRR